MTIILAPSPDKDIGLIITKKLKSLLETLGGKVFLANEVDPSTSCDFIISIGGDGTFLRASQRAIKYKIPILGVNLGTTGFLAEVEKDNLPLLEKLFTQEYKIEKRMLLDAQIVEGGRSLFSDTALNDVVLHRGFCPSLLKLKILSNELLITEIRADGIILSTPTGSTGYSLSAGGPIIDPSAKSISAVPVCSHSLDNRAIVFDENSKIALLPELAADKKAYLSVDGKEYIHISHGMQIEVKKSDKTLDIVKLKNISFYKTLENKLGGSANEITPS